jgi:hypothetical protein
VLSRNHRRREAAESSLTFADKVSLLWHVWATAARVQLALRRQTLPDAVTALGTPLGGEPLPAALLSRAVSRGLRIGPWRPRCLLRSLVLYRLLRAQGDSAVLVIGLRDQATTSDAHAWVELAGRDIGPDPGARGYRELSRYPSVQ